MDLDDLIRKRDDLKQKVAILNLQQLLGYLSEEECQNLSVERNILKELELKIFKIEHNK